MRSLSEKGGFLEGESESTNDGGKLNSFEVTPGDEGGMLPSVFLRLIGERLKCQIGQRLKNA